MAMILSRTSPDPRVGASVELSCRDTSSLLNLVRVSKTLPRKPHRGGKAATSLLAGSAEPATVGMKTWMLSHPGTRLSAAMETRDYR